MGKKRVVKMERKARGACRELAGGLNNEVPLRVWMANAMR